MNESTAIARIVVEELLAHGVTDVVLSPGSRSAPLAFAFAAAQRAGLLALHVRIDERSAGFVALGIAKVTQNPVAVVCTSGSAVANLAPAIVEARYAGVPLIAITADRPSELRNVGANQTIDQVGFFGQQVSTAIDLLGPPQEPKPTAWRKSITRAITAAVGPPPTPTHLNIPFRDPLTPTEAPSSDAPSLLGVDWLNTAGLPRARATGGARGAQGELLREPVNYVVGDLGLRSVPARGLVLVGDVADPEVSVQAIELAQACGWPIISEPSGNALSGPTAVPAASVLLANDAFLAAHHPDLVITVGRFGLSRPIMKIVASARAHVAVHTGGRDRPDPLRTAAAVLNAVPRPPEDDPVIPVDPHDDTWLRQWIQASDEAQRRVQAAIDRDKLTGLAVAATCWDAATADDAIFIAASRSVRNLEAVMTVRQFAPTVLGNRGTSGIDGLVSTAWGVALARDRQSRAERTIAILGDLAFLHDHNGLIAPANEARPNLTIVVADNNGGGIFSSLEQGAPQFAADFERIFGTPHDQDLYAIAAATGHPTLNVTTAAELAEVLAEPSKGVRIVIAQTAGRAYEQAQWAGVLHR